MALLFLSFFWKCDKQLIYKEPFENLVQNAFIISIQLIISYFRKIFKISELLKTYVEDLMCALFALSPILQSNIKFSFVQHLIQNN
jgi:hypothetical protein